MMIISVGSKNKAKVQAVEEVLQNYPSLAKAQIFSFSVHSDISEQPLSLEETIQGAKNRAKNAFEACASCNYGFGIESGLCKAPGTRTGYLHLCACSIFNGFDHHVGFSTGFEVPSSILELIFKNNMNLTEACLHSGISQNSNLGSEEGLVGILTKGRTDRKSYSKECIAAALIQLENAHWYRS
jgi:inosine/xanthosine triphosphatase